MARRSIVQSLFLLLATATDRQLARHIEYLKTENRILRDRLPQRIVLTVSERARIIRFGRPLGHALKELITIVSPRTFLRWVNAEPAALRTRRPPGRPRTPESVRDVVLRLARETGWGSTRIHGELKKLGITSISRSTVINILKEAGIDPGPKRGEGSWAEFLRRHSATLWSCDFFTKSVWTLRGRMTVFVLFFIHVGTRRVVVSGVTANPDRAWMIQQARTISMIFAEQPVPAMILLRDYDGKFVPEFDALLAAEGTVVRPIGPRAPNLNAVAERFVQTVKRECLDHFLALGQGHLELLLNEFLIHYHIERPHQGLNNRPLAGGTMQKRQWTETDAVICEERLGGLLRHYRRSA
jgi:putative transposase